MVNFVMVIDLNGILCYAFGSNIGSSIQINKRNVMNWKNKKFAIFPQIRNYKEGFLKRKIGFTSPNYTVVFSDQIEYSKASF